MHICICNTVFVHKLTDFCKRYTFFKFTLSEHLFVQCISRNYKYSKSNQVGIPGSSLH